MLPLVHMIEQDQYRDYILARKVDHAADFRMPGMILKRKESTDSIRAHNLPSECVAMMLAC